MNRLLNFISLSLIALYISGCVNFQEKKESLPSIENTVEYDSALAAKYGADEYGMKKYIFAFLYRGNNTTIDPDSSAALQNAHLKNIMKMAEQGKLVLAGPFFGNDDLRGIYIFNVESLDEAEQLTNSDPAIEAGILRMELMEWYGSAALMAVNEIGAKLSKKNIVE